MCRRNSLFPPASVLEDRFDADLAFGDYRPRYNVAPGDLHPVVTNQDPDAIDRARWGLVPRWMDGAHDGFANARSETTAEKSSFRDAWESRPCLVLSSGFYEWQDRFHGHKQPYRLFRPTEPAFAMAGLWEPKDGDPGVSITILTTESDGVVEPIHDRMPVVLPRDEESTWLTAKPTARRELCRPVADAGLVADPISRRVNDPTNDDPSIIEPIDVPQRGLGEFG